MVAFKSRPTAIFVAAILAACSPPPDERHGAGNPDADAFGDIDQVERLAEERRLEEERIERERLAQTACVRSAIDRGRGLVASTNEVTYDTMSTWAAAFRQTDLSECPQDFVESALTYVQATERLGALHQERRRIENERNGAMVGAIFGMDSRETDRRIEGYNERLTRAVAEQEAASRDLERVAARYGVMDRIAF